MNRLKAVMTEMYDAMFGRNILNCLETEMKRDRLKTLREKAGDLIEDAYCAGASENILYWHAWSQRPTMDGWYAVSHNTGGHSMEMVDVCVGDDGYVELCGINTTGYVAWGCYDAKMWAGPIPRPIFKV